MVGRQLQDDKGAVLVMALAIMLILLGLGSGYLAMIRTESAIAANELEALRALYIAEAGVAHCLADLAYCKNNTVWGDIDGNSGTDYMLSYSLGTQTYTAYKPDSGGAPQSISFTAASKKYSGALQVGRNIYPTGTVMGTINGNVDAVGTINLGSVTVNGSTTANNTALLIPTAGLADYKTLPGVTQLTTCTSTNIPSGSTGIYYVSGDCTIGPRVGFTLNGTLVVEGNLTLAPISNYLTITPSGDNPAVVAGNDLTISSSWNVNIPGLVYAGRDVIIGDLAGDSLITGAILAKRDLRLYNLNTPNYLTLTYNPDLNPPYFSGGSSGGRLTSWKEE